MFRQISNEQKLSFVIELETLPQKTIKWNSICNDSFVQERAEHNELQVQSFDDREAAVRFTFVHRHGNSKLILMILRLLFPNMLF